MSFSCGVAVMAKASEPGRTKTRLSPPLTLEEAAHLNTAFLGDIADNLMEASKSAPIQGYMAYAPASFSAKAFFERHMPPAIGLFDVDFPDFGVCLQAALNHQFERGHAAACVLNSDSPTLPVEVLVETARLLAKPGERVVLGPASDGGYYLLGVKQVYAPLFEGISWSTGAVFAQTHERASDLGLEVHLLPEWYDVDDAQALICLIKEVLEGTPYHLTLTSSPALKSRALLADMRAHHDLDLKLGQPLMAGLEGPSSQPGACT